MPAVRSLYQDPFAPILLSSPPLNVTDEQKRFVRKVLDTACSDSRFSQKAYDAIQLILTGGSVVSPVITSLSPNNVVLGSPSFTLHVRGNGFKAGSIIMFNGSEEVTTRVSDTELTTIVNMATALNPVVVPIAVVSTEGVISNTMSFEFLPSASGVFAANKSTELKTELKKEEKELKEEKK